MVSYPHRKKGVDTVLKLLIADSSAACVSALEIRLRDQLQILGCFDGNTAAELLESYRPDILLINLMLPHKDGLSVLQKASFRPAIILAIVPNLSTYTLHALRELGVDYTMLSPSIESICLRLQDLIRNTHASRRENDLDAIILYHLDSLGIPSHLEGYQQLATAISLFSRNPRQYLTKELYPAVAKKCGSKDLRSVERSIRHAVHSAWLQRDPAIWSKYFPTGPKGKIPCPSNKVFICRLTQMLNNR